MVNLSREGRLLFFSIIFRKYRISNFYIKRPSNGMELKVLQSCISKLINKWQYTFLKSWNEKFQINETLPKYICKTHRYCLPLNFEPTFKILEFSHKNVDCMLLLKKTRRTSKIGPAFPHGINGLALSQLRPEMEPALLFDALSYTQ